MDGCELGELVPACPWLLFVLAIAFLSVHDQLHHERGGHRITLPVSLVIANYLGWPHVIFFASLAAAGMPFNLLIGAAPTHRLRKQAVHRGESSSTAAFPASSS